MLIYHPAYDAHHAAFRMLLLTDELKTVDFPKLQILDFYFAFPGQMQHARLLRDQGFLRKLSETLHNPYHGPVNAGQSFKDMRHVQEAAARALVAAGLFDSEQFQVGIASRTTRALPELVSQGLQAARARANDLVEVLTVGLASIPTTGPDGLKARTGLLEYRYDAA